MKVHQFISSLDDAKYGRRRLGEENEVADSPSHAPTSSAGYKTPSSGKSKDEGDKMGGEKDAIKKSDSAIPAPVAKAPSHAPTSTAQWKTKGEKSDDEGEKISKEAMKENLIRSIIDSDEDVDVAQLIAQADIREGGHKAGCTCGFCKNKGKFGKKKEDEGGESGEEDKDKMQENHLPPMRPMSRPSMGKPPMGKPAMRRPGAAGATPGRMGFRHPASPRPKAMAPAAPYQPSMEALDASKNPAKTIQEMADKLLEAPDKR